MILIAHRGLMEGPDKNLENRPEQIELALSKNYHCEVDVWKVKNEWWLGHDEPTYKVNEPFIGKDKLWLHCKNLDALYDLSTRNIRYVYFWHQEDDFTLTSNEVIWTYPGKPLTNNSVAVLPEWDQDYWNYVKSIKSLYGVCTDYVEKFIKETGTLSVGSAP